MALSFKGLLLQSEFWVFLFVLCLALLNWPMLTLAENSVVWGMPAILIYLPVVWLLIVVAIYIFDRGYTG
jgi:hypothetical protein